MLRGKNAVITGARRGIGRAAVECFASYGANVWACARKRDEAFEADMAALGDEYGVWIKPVYFDMADAEAIKAGIREIMGEKLPIDVLVNNAGITGRNTTVQLTSISEMKEIFDVNFIAPVLMIQALSRRMAKAESGAIVNVVSTAGLGASAGYGSYGASKAALCQLTQTLARELAPFGVRVNGVAPSAVDTDMLDALNTSARENTIGACATNRAASPDEVAQSIAFLSSERASFITGQILRLDGGML